MVFYENCDMPNHSDLEKINTFYLKRWVNPTILFQLRVGQP